MPPLASLKVSPSGAEIAFVDSGVPPGAKSYTTIFAVHGMGFTHAIFQKIVNVASAQGIRFVAIVRRDYPGSSLFDEEETAAIGNVQLADEWVKARGQELAHFIADFVQKYSLPPISDDGKTGGITLLSWSLGTYVCMSTLAHVTSLPGNVRDCLTSRLRAFVVHEPPPFSLGYTMPVKDWAPIIDNTIPMEYRFPFWGQWLTSFFEHPESSKRDVELLNYVLPSTDKVPVIFSMSKSEIEEVVYGDNFMRELGVVFNFGTQLKANYQKALFDKETRDIFPNMKVSYLTGEWTVSWAYASMWSVQDDAKAFNMEKFIDFKIIKGSNHFVQWEQPEQTLKLYAECSGL
ncbi:hypothetical protein BDP27DRAFT_1274398 [Rhodocollybia butyracea]|uniref:AB hydrolase-1 domain-containing protein n=1 Tax=Rhodocollybia butyracea TaxID=206335 RepID=A0A9P5P9V3_9AGAR|nr:hypothetical protein BDP27DRAFT_1274398 [Rhodocollybia butyracea]